MDLGALTATATMRVFAVDGTYHPAAGDPLAVRVVLDRDVEPATAGQQSTTVERRTELTGFHSELADARRGEQVTVGADTWRLDRRDRDDGYLVTWWVVPVTT